MRRFLPYLQYLRGRRLALVIALLCGAVSGLVYGYGLPKVMNEVFPKIFTNAVGEAGCARRWCERKSSGNLPPTAPLVTPPCRFRP